MTAARSAPGPTGQAVDPAEPTDPGATGAPAVSDPAAADTTGGRRSSGPAPGNEAKSPSSA